MKTTKLWINQIYCHVLAVVAVAGLLGESRLLMAQEGANSSRERVLETLRAARQEYLSGPFVENEKRILSEFYLAEQNQKTIAEGVRQARSLLDKKIITAKQMESAELALENAGKSLEVAQEKLKSLRDFRPKVLELFDRLERAIREGKANQLP